MESAGTRLPPRAVPGPNPVTTTGPAVVRIELSLKSLLIVLALLAGLWLLLHVVPALMVLVMAMMLTGVNRLKYTAISGSRPSQAAIEQLSSWMTRRSHRHNYRQGHRGLLPGISFVQ